MKPRRAPAHERKNKEDAIQPPAGTIHRSIRLLSTAIEELDASLPLPDIERIAITVNLAMTAQARSFHTPEHVFDLVDPGNPYITLAALFHDLVYYQVDRGFIPQIAEAVEPSIEPVDGGLQLRTKVDARDRQLALTMAVFGFQPGDRLDPYGGMNEFLSALVMNRMLGESVRDRDLILSTACVEATIPFRKPDAQGLRPADRLVRRLEEAAHLFALDLPEGRIEQGVQWAVRFANRDVANFGEKEVTRFLDNTWKLLPESNPSLRTQGIYSIQSYRLALQGMEGFLRALNPSTIFAQYAGDPPDVDFKEMSARAERNVATARTYLGIKLLTAAILEALANESGGDAPISLFMGDIGAKQKGSRLEDYLPDSRTVDGLSVDNTLYELLATGRASASRFDLQNSPLSLFIYLHLGDNGFRAHLENARELFAARTTPKSFLNDLPVELTEAIAEACAQMVVTRSEVLRSLARSRRS